MAEYQAIWEGWKIPVEDDGRPWRLVIQPRSDQPSTQPSSEFDPGARAEAEELFRSASGAYPGTWQEPDEDE